MPQPPDGLYLPRCPFPDCGGVVLPHCSVRHPSCTWLRCQVCMAFVSLENRRAGRWNPSTKTWDHFEWPEEEAA